MKKEKKLGIWMDHASAHVMEFTQDGIEEKQITSEFTPEEKKLNLDRGEKTIHNREQREQSEYYKKIGEVIINYDEVLVFGPTDAKTELLNTLREDHHFEKIKIAIEPADKMTENQQHAFVKNYFSKQ